MIKKVFYLLLILFCIKSNAQYVRVYAGFGLYAASDFKSNSFGELGGGVEVKMHRFFKPEVGLSYFFGSLEDYNRLDNNGTILDVSSKKVNAVNYNITPKIALYSTEVNAGDVFLQILPRYNVSKIEAERLYTVINQSNPEKSVTKRETLTQWQQSIGIGVGIDIVLSDKSYDTVAINAYYNGVNLGKPLTDINNSSSRYNTNTVGMGVSYYLGFGKKKL
ncbi:outer membrane beta-barrel protein [Flavobacterium poyangense]|uniref:outer membrane beta-barrel protein n=1 Tax=Flavobacterium poyangense TaxID=2204302 RepID=UPI001420FCD1|nr:outer membrane beta-barrel protein [Flavobacterium sp. JXAS1]